MAAPRLSVRWCLPAAAVAVVLASAAMPAQAQMFHLYLLCQGSIAAGLPPGVQPSQAPVSPVAPVLPAVASRGADAPADSSSDKNDSDANENLQARTRAVKSASKRGSAQLELALRDNNMTAFVQRSNVLPTGERMKYVATQTHYSAVYSPATTSRAYVDWRGSWLFTWFPPFQKMTATRFSIDRQTGQLEGEIVGPAGEVLGLMDMQCEPKRDGEGPPPRF
jgi:hypothetical protein